MDMNEINRKAQLLVSKMTLEEKTGLCSGESCWELKSVPRLGLPSITMMDGPHGLRKQIGSQDNLGIGESWPAVCFPTASALACSFDRALVKEIGAAIGQACVAEDVSVVLGPGVNMKRSPLCGRNFEYFSEDPVVSGELAAAMIQGIQSTGTGASLKHFAVNNQESYRMTVDVAVDERAFREFYLKAFEIAVKKGHPHTVMCAYNRLFGAYCSENETLLTDILRHEWGFEGLVVSDWGAVHDRVAGLIAGMDLEMPGNHGYNDQKILDAIRQKSLPEATLDTAAHRITRLILQSTESLKDKAAYDPEQQHALAVKAAARSMVLLKNDGDILPLKTRRIGVIGALAKSPRFQAAGSSKINPIQVDTPFECLKNQGFELDFADGYTLPPEKTKPLDRTKQRIEEACQVAQSVDTVLIFAGLPEGMETEGVDRKHLSLPDEQNRLIEAVCKVNARVAVILMCGAPVTLPWIDNVPALLLMYLSGEGCGTALTQLLTGEVVPTGKLAESWPLSLSDTPSSLYFPGNRSRVEYRESIWVGYRYYDTAQKAVLFPFGYGLSYTTFSYSDLALFPTVPVLGQSLTLTLKVKNTGNTTGEETVFLYSAQANPTLLRPRKELRDFIKCVLATGEEKTIVFTLDPKDLGYYHPDRKDWDVEPDSYTLMVGGSPLNLHAVSFSLQNPGYLPPDTPVPDVYRKLSQNPLEISKHDFETLLGHPLPPLSDSTRKPYTLDSILEDVQHTLLGRLIFWAASKMMEKTVQAEAEQKEMMLATVREMPFFAIISSEALTQWQMLAVLSLLNGKPLAALKFLLKRKTDSI